MHPRLLEGFPLLPSESGQTSGPPYVCLTASLLLLHSYLCQSKKQHDIRYTIFVVPNLPMLNLDAGEAWMGKLYGGLPTYLAGGYPSH